jgi:transcriptional regulator with XRE-family HTH domain
MNSPLLGVSRRTLENWERGRRSPARAARVLIQAATAHPKTVLEAVARALNQPVGPAVKAES